MNYLISVIYRLLFFSLTSTGLLYAVAFEFPVHVLLEKKIVDPAKQELLWTITGDGFLLSDPCDPERSLTMQTTECALYVKNNAIFIDNKRLGSKRIKIEALKGHVKVNDQAYEGALVFLPDGNLWHLVNTVDLESYVCSVLRSESWPGWPLEVNKAFAVMQRSYVVAKLLKARGKKKLGKGYFYDIGCTNLDQTYQGAHCCASLHQAVQETKGMVLAHDKKPIMAMYDVCCGGLIPAKMQGVDFKGSPYLARAYPCTHCTNCKVYRWKAVYTLEECERLLRTVEPSARKVRDMKVAQIDKAGIVQQVKVKSGKRWVNFSRKQIYSLFKDIKSYSFTITRQGNKIIFAGRGYGHHLGVCQWGVRQMVEDGWLYKDILMFFYPGTNFMKLEFTEQPLHSQQSFEQTQA